MAELEGKIYVIGGLGSSGAGTAVEVYDPITDSWASAAPLPRPRHHAAAAGVGGKLYVVGGFERSFSDPQATVYEYDPAADRWTEKTPMPTARGALAAAVVGGQLYAIGGAGTAGNVAATEVYDPAADQWEERAPLPIPRDHLAVAWSRAGSMPSAGGWS